VFERLLGNIITDLENRTFKDAQTLDEFLGVKWARMIVKLVVMQVRREYDVVITKAMKKETAEARMVEEFEKLPDNVSL
jgi:hypothetical protein